MASNTTMQCAPASSATVNDWPTASASAASSVQPADPSAGGTPIPTPTATPVLGTSDTSTSCTVLATVIFTGSTSATCVTTVPVTKSVTKIGLVDVAVPEHAAAETTAASITARATARHPAFRNGIDPSL